MSEIDNTSVNSTQSTKHDSSTQQFKVPATYMRGGTSKGVFFKLTDLPDVAQIPGQERDALLLRLIGSPDPYGKHTDGMGGATSSTSKAVIVSKSKHDNHDVDYLFAQIAIDKAFVDWSGNCGNLSSAVGPFAITHNLIDPERIPENGIVEVRIWQANINKTIIAKVPIKERKVQEMGDFELDGVTFPAAEIELTFMYPSAGDSSMFPTGNLIDELDVPGIGKLKATMINAGIPTIFLTAESVGFEGTELQSAINTDEAALTMFETIRAYGAKRMGLIQDIDEAKNRQHTPKIAYLSKASSYQASSGKQINKDDIDIAVRALSMGQLHHAMMGTAAVAIATAASIPGTLVNIAAGGGTLDLIRFGHPSGTLSVGAKTKLNDGEWQAIKAIMSRSARVLMEGTVSIPSTYLSDIKAKTN